jgi:hypothetical protein
VNGPTRPVPQLAEAQFAEADYDGTAPFTGGGEAPATVQGRARAAATAAFVVVPFAGLGVTVGFHRLLTHRGFTAVRALRTERAVIPGRRLRQLPVSSDRLA